MSNGLLNLVSIAINFPSDISHKKSQLFDNDIIYSKHTVVWPVAKDTLPWQPFLLLLAAILLRYRIY